MGHLFSRDGSSWMCKMLSYMIHCEEKSGVEFRGPFTDRTLFATVERNVSKHFKLYLSNSVRYAGLP